MQAWIVVGSPENFRVLAEDGFQLAAFKSTRRRQAEEMEPGDRLVFYIKGEVAFAGTAEVTSPVFEDHSDIGLESEGKPDEVFPFRVKTRPIVVVENPERWVDVREITDRLDKTRELGPKKLGMAFRGNLHKISAEDYAVIEQLLRAE